MRTTKTTVGCLKCLTLFPLSHLLGISHSPETADERQPLLAPTPSETIPRAPFVTLLALRATDAISFSIIFAYVAPMMLHLGAPVKRVGFYAGLAEGGMMVTEAILAPLWASKIGPRFGKFRCLQFGTTCNVTAVVLMAFASSPWHVVLCRFCMGLNPMAIMSRSILSELVTKETRVRAFSLFTPSYVGGIMIGNLMGGLLAKPGGALGEIAIVQRWPFILPSLFCACISLVSLSASTIFLGKFRHGSNPSVTAESGNANAPMTPKDSTVWKDMRHCSSMPGFRSLILLVGFFECTKHGWNAIYPLYAYTDVKFGGLGLSIPVIGSILTASTVIYITVSATVFARIHSAFGASRLIPLCLSCFPLLILCFPLGEWVARAHRSTLWSVVGAQLILRNGAAFTNQMVDTSILAMVDQQPEMTTMAYALKMMAAAVGKAVGPVTAGTLFSLSRQAPLSSFGHSIGWLGLFLISLPMCFIAVNKYRGGSVRLT